MDFKENEFREKIVSVNIDRRKFLKFAAAASTAVMLGPALIGCGTPATTAPANVAAGGVSGLITKKGESMVGLFTSKSIEYYKGWSQGAIQAVKALGMNYEELMNEGQANTELSQMETKANQNVKMIFITAPDPSIIPAMANLANTNKVYLANTWESPDWVTPLDFGDYYVTYFIPASLKAAYEMAKTLFEAMGGKGNIVHVSGWPGGTPDWQRTAGLKKAMLEYPNIKLLGSQPGKWSRDESRKVMENMITTHPKIDGVFCQNDDIALGVMNALEESGKKIPIVGIDGSKENIDMIKAGRITATYTSFPFWQAGYSAVTVFDACNGWKPTPPERSMFTDGFIVDKSNADAYFQKFFGSDILPFDWKLMSKILHPDDWDPQNVIYPMDPDVMWEGQPNRKYPDLLKASKDSGEFDKVTKMYADHYKKKIF